MRLTEQDSSDTEGIRLICSERPCEGSMQQSKIYVFNQVDGRVHTYNTFGGIREEE